MKVWTARREDDAMSSDLFGANENFDVTELFPEPEVVDRLHHLPRVLV